MTVRKPKSKLRRTSIELLEQRQVLTLLGVVPTFPLSTYGSPGVINYNPITDVFSMTATPLTFQASSTSPPQTYTAPDGLFLQIDVDHNGNLLNDGTGDDFAIVGTINGSPSYSGTLLTGKVIDFGFLNSGGSTSSFDFVAIPTGGALFSAGYFAGSDIGITTTSDNSTFTNSFAVPFTGDASGSFGSVPAPTLATTASPNVTLGPGTTTLTDTANLQAPYNNVGGSITFTLTQNGNPVPGATQSDPVTGNGSYSASYTLPNSSAAAGTYVWTANYSVNGHPVATDDGANETTLVSLPMPAINTTIYDATGALPTGALGEEVYDTATVIGGTVTPTGMVAYDFYNTANPVYGTTTPVNSQTVNLSGGSAPNSAITAALAAGNYSYIAVYSGDANYQGSVSAVEPLTINKGTLTLNTAILDAATGNA